ncbi:MAG: hypothetical protein Q7T21_11750 [Gallionella sp.]|nr:hypothetical protein [Gallionella sp.]
MLSAIFGNKSVHPMVDIKSAQALLDDLPKNDAFQSLMELTELVALLLEHTDFKLDHQFAVLRLFDAAAQPYVRKLVREYFTPIEINKFQENRLWSALGSWFRQIATAYFKLFTDFCNAEKGSSAIKAQMPLLGARAVHAMMWQLKLVSAHYGQIDNTFWANLMQLYKHAEQLQYLSTPVSLYPGLASNASVKCEVGNLLVWYDSEITALIPQHMHLTERLITKYRSTIDIHSQLAQHSRIGFDLNRPGEPTRINMGATTHSSMRFIGMPAMQPKLEELMKVLKKNIVPDDINLGGNYSAEVVGEAVQHLLNYLAAPPVRRNVRRAAHVTLSVVNGFDKVVERTGERLGFDETTLAHWVTDEISVGGFSTLLPVKGSEDIGIGSLLGIQPEGVPHWGVAVVRRLQRKNENQMNVGAEILDNRVAGVVLNYNSVAGEAIEKGQPALWLYSKQNESSGEAQLLMKADTFSPGRSLKIMLNGTEYLLMPIGLQERGLVYDLAKFRFVIQEVSTEESY